MQKYLDFFVHDTSLIDENVIIGKNTKIWHFCHILPHTKIGECCSFGQNCMVGPNVVIGKNCKVQNNVSIYEGVMCEDNVFIGPSVVFSNVINPRAFIVRKDSYRPTLLKKGCSVGANATIICGNTIGKYALIGAGSVVTKNIPDYALVVGNPARIIGYVDQSGEKLDFIDNKAFSKNEKHFYYLKNNQVFRDDD
ncbi:acetyltransferase [Helicobacter sp. faydin-H20]|uniref:acyltransferase n=1 Tax=Helicobacter anatolicus TaxID=2905874 RepID=UPI001E330612|nr:acyltransferase [Helicobacter anatolicus]MCE3037024.1 acetyltransferase [Helicobacter anatolicus]MCE3038192.1 acetyltransferase [Helicobacter anatolicus]